MPILELKNITKRYEKQTAVDGVSFSIPEGSVYGLLGPNGAGKTTIIRMITQILAPDSGKIFFHGKEISADTLIQIGYMPEERGLYKKMTVEEQLLYLTQIRGLLHREAVENLKLWVKKMEIQTWMKKKTMELSKGMQQKLQFIVAVAHRPKVLILDEPFSGLDPINTEIIQKEILELNKNGTTIIFSTHRMEQVEEMCRNICLINKAKIILEGNLKEIKSRYKTNEYWVAMDCTADKLQSIPSIEIVHQNEKHLTLRIRENISPNKLLSALMEKGTVKYFSEKEPLLNEIFIKEVTKQS